jgi:hypothetical protein
MAPLKNQIARFVEHYNYRRHHESLQKMAPKHMNYIQKARSILAEKIDVEEDLLDVYTLLVFTTGSDTELVDVHEAWAIWKNKTDPSHKSLVPFSELTPEVRALDRKYVEAIQETAREISREG